MLQQGPSADLPQIDSDSLQRSALELCVSFMVVAFGNERNGMLDEEESFTHPFMFFCLFPTQSVTYIFC